MKKKTPRGPEPDQFLDYGLSCHSVIQHHLSTTIETPLDQVSTFPYARSIADERGWEVLIILLRHRHLQKQKTKKTKKQKKSIKIIDRNLIFNFILFCLSRSPWLSFVTALSLFYCAFEVFFNR